MRPFAATVGASIGLFVAGVSVFLGQCGAFGGPCPDPRPPLLEDDVFGGLLVGLALAVFAVVSAVRPDRRGLLTAVGIVLVVVVPIAHVVAGAAYRGGL